MLGAEWWYPNSQSHRALKKLLYTVEVSRAPSLGSMNKWIQMVYIGTGMVDSMYGLGLAHWGFSMF